MANVPGEIMMNWIKNKIKKMWRDYWYPHVELGVVFEFNDDVSEDSDPVPCTESEDVSVRHSLNIYM